MDLAAIIVFAPLLAAALTGAAIPVIKDRPAQVITTGLVGLSALCAWSVFYQVAILGESTHVRLLPWINSGSLHVDWSILVDPLTASMMVLVTTVSALVHLYSIGYMSHDPSKPRFMAYLSLFTFFMLMLVSADNLVQLFLGWEGVGLCSYLLIGFWYHKPSANAAAMKAFIVNRVGDFGFALGIFAIFVMFDSIRFDEIFAAAPSMADATMSFLGYELHAMTVICALLFIGCMGKSAQLGLHTWLPDAMEGPTPVSALIHAATMVTAGVFLVARCSPLFELAPDVLMVITLVGAATAFFAATIGLVQNDIKRVIAYSTCSQLGYMFFACGVSAYAAGIFHLLTHGFFKALLFLGAGAVIHAMSDEQDMRNMGGIWKKIPYTFALMWIGSLALAGIPPFAGYFSKDVVLEAAYAAHSTHGLIAFWLGIGAAFMTAFYSWRLLFMTFNGKPRADETTMNHVHESPAVMMIPLIILAIGAIFAGWAGYSLGMVDPEGAFWRGAIFVLPEHNVLEAIHHVDWWVPWLPLAVGLTGIALAWLFYIKVPSLPGVVMKKFSGVHRFLYNKWFIDELYEAVFVKNAIRLGVFFSNVGDKKLIDGLGPNGFAALSLVFGKRTGAMQTGYIYHYAFAMLIGLLALSGWLLFGQLSFGGGTHG